MHAREKKQYKILIESLRERRHMEHLSVGGRIIIKWLLKKRDVRGSALNSSNSGH